MKQRGWTRNTLIDVGTVWKGATGWKIVSCWPECQDTLHGFNVITDSSGTSLCSYAHMCTTAYSCPANAHCDAKLYKLWYAAVDCIHQQHKHSWCLLPLLTYQTNRTEPCMCLSVCRQHQYNTVGPHPMHVIMCLHAYLAGKEGE